jgi:hypothetical protein
MKLTRTNRIIIVVAGVLVLLILIFPPYQRETLGCLLAPRSWEYSGHKLIGPKPPGCYRYRIDGGQLALEVAIVVLLAGVLMVLLHKNPKPKPEPDKDA